MKEETFRTLEIFFLFLSVIIIPGVVLIINKTKKEAQEASALTTIQNDLQKHLEECDKIPKVVIVEKLDHITSKVEDFCDRLDEQREDIKEVKKDFKDETGFQRKRYHDLNVALQSLMTDKIEKVEHARSATSQG